MRRRGYPIEILPEAVAWRRARGLEGTPEPFKPIDLEAAARAIGIDPDRLIFWEQTLGLVRADRFGRFDYRDLVALKVVKRLWSAGLSERRIVMGLTELSPYMARMDKPLAVLERVELAASRELIKREGNDLVGAGGQMFFGFNEPEAKLEKVVRVGQDPDTLFQIAVAREEQGRLEESRDTYLRVLEHRPSAAVHYNLANVLADRREDEQAERHYASAVSLDPYLSTGWYNRALVQERLGRYDDAIHSLRKALRIDPHFADAHYRLATLFEARGELLEARGHWLAYVNIDPEGSMCEHARTRLAALASSDRRAPSAGPGAVKEMEDGRPRLRLVS